MMLFSKIKSLADAYEEWVKQDLKDGSKIKDCPLSVISFLDGKGLFSNRERTIREVWNFITDYNMGTQEQRLLFQLQFDVKIKTEKDLLVEKIAEEIIDKVDDMIGGKMIAQALREMYLDEDEE